MLSSYGLGNAEGVQIGTQVASAGGSALASTLIATGSVGGPVGVAIGAGIALVATLVGVIFKPDVNKIATTNIVNQVEPYMKQNLQAWQQSAKTTADQQQAEATFNYLWQQVVSSCSNSQYGSAGQNCIGDRQVGGKLDWFALYYDPIANDPGVQQSMTDVISGGDSTWLMIGAGLVVLGVLA